MAKDLPATLPEVIRLGRAICSETGWTALVALLLHGLKRGA